MLITLTPGGTNRRWRK